MEHFNVKSAILAANKRADQETHKISERYVSPLRLAFCRETEIAIASADIPLGNLSEFLANLGD